MGIRQVFSEYRIVPGDQPQEIRYCPRCGTACTVSNIAGRERPACPKCGFTEYRNPSPAVAVLIVDNGSVLLGRRSPESYKGCQWCLPCGFVEFDEDFLSAAIREVKEETGLDVKLASITNVAFNYLSPKLHTLVVVLLAEPIGGSLCAGDDLEAVQWFPLTGPLPLMAFESDTYIINRLSEGEAAGLPVDRRFASH